VIRQEEKKKSARQTNVEMSVKLLIQKVHVKETGQEVTRHSGVYNRQRNRGGLRGGGMSGQGLRKRAAQAKKKEEPEVTRTMKMVEGRRKRLSTGNHYRTGVRPKVTLKDLPRREKG